LVKSKIIIAKWRGTLRESDVIGSGFDLRWRWIFKNGGRASICGSVATTNNRKEIPIIIIH